MPLQISVIDLKGGRYRIGDAIEGARTVGVSSALNFPKMNLLELGVERELARAECKARVHCLVSVVPLEPDSLTPSPQHWHLVIAARSYQYRLIVHGRRSGSDVGSL